MVKKLGQVVVLTLALNFLAVAGGVGWLWQGGKLGKEQVGQIREILFPPPPKPEEVKLDEAPAADPATTQPGLRLQELLARASGRTAAEQVEFIQQAFDAQMSQLDRRQRELLDLQRQVDLARQQLANDRAAQEKRETQFTEAQNQQARQAEDKGFQDSLALFQSMPSKQVKTVFMGMPDDAAVARYLQAMPPRAASRIIKEFKTPDEAARIQRVLDRVRSGAQASAAGN